MKLNLKKNLLTIRMTSFDTLVFEMLSLCPKFKKLNSIHVELLCAKWPSLCHRVTPKIRNNAPYESSYLNSCLYLSAAFSILKMYCLYHLHCLYSSTIRLLQLIQDCFQVTIISLQLNMCPCLDYLRLLYL